MLSKGPKTSTHGDNRGPTGPQPEPKYPMGMRPADSDIPGTQSAQTNLREADFCKGMRPSV